MAINFSALPAQLQQYVKVHNNQLFSELIGAGMEFKKYMDPVFGDNQIALVNFKTQKMVQSGEFNPNDTTCGFTPTPGFTVGARVMTLQKGKINLKLHKDNIEQMYQNVIGATRTSGPRTGTMEIPKPFEGQILSAIVAQAATEIGEAAILGSYTPFATTNLGIVNGLRRLMVTSMGTANGIPMNQILPLVGITNTNAVAQVRAVIQRVIRTKPFYHNQKMIVLVGPMTKFLYEENFSTIYNGGMRPANSTYGQDFVEGYPNFRFVVDANLNGSNAILITTEGNLKYGVDNEARFTHVEIEKFEYCLKFMLDFKIGFEMVLGGEVWCNDPTQW